MILELAFDVNLLLPVFQMVMGKIPRKREQSKINTEKKFKNFKLYITLIDYHKKIIDIILLLLFLITSNLITCVKANNSNYVYIHMNAAFTFVKKYFINH